MGEKDYFPKIELDKLGIHAITEKQCVNYVFDQLDQRKGGWIVTPNLDHMRRIKSDKNFANIYTSASLVVADGMPLIWASRLQGTPLPERVAGSNLINSLSAAAAEKNRSVFLLGGNLGAAKAAAKALKSTHPSLLIAGYYYPEKGFEDDVLELEKLSKILCESKPDIVYVALGSPKQEKVIDVLRKNAALPNVWWVGVGISFSFLSGEIKRAPSWMQTLGLEWFHRLAQEPSRLMRRYLMYNLPFAFLLLGGSFRKRFINIRGRIS